MQKSHFCRKTNTNKNNLAKPYDYKKQSYQLMKTYFLILYFFCFQWNVFSQNLNWTQSIGQQNGSSKGLSITTDTKGNIYTTGYFGDTPDFDYSSGTYTLTSKGQTDVFITKHDSSGHLKWAKSVGGIHNDEGHSITLDNSGNILITGIFNDTVDIDPNPLSTYFLEGTWFNNVFILKLDSNGNFIWAKKINYAVARSITSDKAKNIYLTGSFSFSTDFDLGTNIDTLRNLGNSDAFLLKLDSMGNNIWVKNIGASSASVDGNCVALDTSENIYVTGNYDGTSDFNPGSSTNLLHSAGSTDVFILKLDNNGNYIWSKKMGGTGMDRSSELIVDENKNIYTTGFFEYTVDFNPHIVGTYTLNAAYGLNSFVSKLDSSGNFLWAKNIGGTISNNTATGIAKDDFNNLYITGSYMNTTDFDPGIDSFYVYMTTFNYHNYAYILKLDSIGNFINVKVFGNGCYNAFSEAVAIDIQGNVLNTGSFYGTGDFDPSNSTQNLTSKGYSDIYVSKFKNENYVGIYELGKTEQNIIYTYPNPNNGTFNVVSKEKMILTVFDNLGQIVQSIELNEANDYHQVIQIHTSGIYYIKGFTEQSSIKQKIIVTQ